MPARLGDCTPLCVLLRLCKLTLLHPVLSESVSILFDVKMIFKKYFQQIGMCWFLVTGNECSVHSISYTQRALESSKPCLGVKSS